MVTGRPRTLTPQYDDLVALGEEMVKWVKENEPLHVSSWYIGQKKILRETWRKYILKEEFRPYYEQAIQIIGNHYLDKNSNVRSGVAERFLRLYFHDLRELEDETARFNATIGQTITDESPKQAEIDKVQSDMQKDHEIARLKSLLEKHGHQC